MSLARVALRAWVIGSFVAVALAFSGTTGAQNGPAVIWSQAILYTSSIAFSTDGQFVVEGGGNSDVRIRRASDGSIVRSLTVSDSNRPLAVAISPDGQYVADGTDASGGNFNVWRAADGVLVRGRILAHNNGTATVAFSPDNKQIATGGRDGTIKLWQLPGVELIRTLNAGTDYMPWVTGVAYSPDGQFLAVATQDGVDLWRVADGTLVRSFLRGEKFTGIAYSPDGQTVAATAYEIDAQGQCADCAVKIWRVADGALYRSFADTSTGGKPVGPWSLAFSPDGQTILEGVEAYVNTEYVGGLRFWRISDGVLVASYDLESGSNAVLAVAYAPDGNSFAYAGYQALVLAHSPTVSQCSSVLSPTSTSIPATGGDGTVSLMTGITCNWTAQSNASWITITSAGSGTGNAVIHFDVAANPTSNSRTGTLSIGDQTFTVTQDGAANPSCTTGVSSHSSKYATSGGTGHLTITTQLQCPWSVSSNVNWITFTSPTSGAGNATVSYTVESNSTEVVRRGTITINGQTIAVKQKVHDELILK